MACQGAPARWGRWAVAEAGMASPMTWEKFTPPLFEDAPLRNHPANAATAFGARPGVAEKSGVAIQGFQALADACLQVQQVGLDGPAIGLL